MRFEQIARSPRDWLAEAGEVGKIESNLCSGGEAGLLGELIEGLAVVAGGGAQVVSRPGARAPTLISAQVVVR